MRMEWEPPLCWLRQGVDLTLCLIRYIKGFDFTDILVIDAASDEWFPKRSTQARSIKYE